MGGAYFTEYCMCIGSLQTKGKTQCTEQQQLVAKSKMCKPSLPARVPDVCSLAWKAKELMPQWYSSRVEADIVPGDAWRGRKGLPSRVLATNLFTLRRWVMLG